MRTYVDPLWCWMMHASATFGILIFYVWWVHTNSRRSSSNWMQCNKLSALDSIYFGAGWSLLTFLGHHGENMRSSSTKDTCCRSFQTSQGTCLFSGTSAVYEHLPVMSSLASCERIIWLCHYNNGKGTFPLCLARVYDEHTLMCFVSRLGIGLREWHAVVMTDAKSVL